MLPRKQSSNVLPIVKGLLKMLPRKQSSNSNRNIVKDQDSRETSPAGKDKWHLQSCTGAKVPEIEI